MMMMVRGLGVRCITCHVGKEPDDLSTFDFQSDAKPNKLNARLMLKMQNDINEKTLPSFSPIRRIQRNPRSHASPVTRNN